jgi:hypothetical protein
MLKLKADPTFSAAVSIPVAGGKAEKVKFTFRHRTKDQLKAWQETVEGKDDAALILEMASGWDLAEPFDLENVTFLVQNYMGSGNAVVQTYMSELSGARLGN